MVAGCLVLDYFCKPGHSKDSICLIGDGKIFSGDTLFVGSCGRIDLEGGSASEIYDSIFDVLYGLDEQLIMYPGHDYGSVKISTIGDQKRTNPIMRKIPKGLGISDEDCKKRHRVRQANR